MRMGNLPPSVSEETVLRLRAKLDDLSFQVVNDRDSKHIAFRVPGEGIELLNALEYLGEFLSEETLEGVDRVLIISDREVEVANGSVMAKKVEVRREDDEKLYTELRQKMTPDSPPLVFTTENDILELYRVAIRTRGSVKGEEITEGVLRTDLPKEGAIFYIIYDDGYRKMGRDSFIRKVDERFSNMQTQPRVRKDERTGESSKVRTAPSILGGTTGNRNQPPPGPASGVRSDLRAILKETTRSLESLGYREDPRFSRPDVNQVFLIGMNGPTLLLKVMAGGEDISSFLRVMEHRKDVLGVLLSKDWSMETEALSRTKGFLYLTGERTMYAAGTVRLMMEGRAG